MATTETIRVTLDTGVLDGRFNELQEAANALSQKVDFATVTVADRERGEDESRPDLPLILETAVLDESRWGSAVLASEASAALFEQIRQIISGGSYRAPEVGDPLHEGVRHQVRDAMVLEAHVREGRDVFVTTDAKGFINHGRREELESLCGTLIMTPDEFIAWCRQ